MNKDDGFCVTFNPLINFLFPKICLICGSEREYLCDQCICDLEKPQLKCFRCNRKNPFGLYCATCRKPFLPNKIIATFKYEGRLKEAIHQYKYEDAYILSKDLAKGLIPLVKKLENYQKFDLAFIPLSKEKMRSRGYNQAELLAEEVGEALGLRVIDLIDRLAQEETQVLSKTKMARKQNIEGIFKIKKNIGIPKNLILMDDVVTTGATVEEATRVLKRAGVQKVVVIVLAMGST